MCIVRKISFSAQWDYTMMHTALQDPNLCIRTILYLFYYYFFFSPEKAKKSLSQRDDQIKSQKDEIKQLKHKLTVQEKITNSSESSNKKYLSALVHSQGLIKSLVTTVTTALGDMADIADGEEDDKKSVKKEETTE